jgi:anti-sigma regulatory factor (Ser/Thr protein kinase)
VELSFPASPAHLGDLRRSMRTGLSGVVPEADLEDMLLAVNEAATNAILHGSGDGHPVDVTVHVRDGWIEVSVLDRGPTLPGSDHGDRTDPQVSHAGGRGLWIIGRLVDEVRLERVDDGTRITLRRRIGVRAEPSATQER